MLQRGLMMDRPLLISAIIEHAAAQHGETEIVSRETHGPVFRYSYADCAARARKLANAHLKLSLPAGCAVGTLAWNNHRHVEIYYAVSGTGLHWSINHDSDKIKSNLVSCNMEPIIWESSCLDNVNKRVP